jgi:DinB superfamily
LVFATSGTAMVQLIPWLERRWSFHLPVGAFPGVVERLRGTPARARELVVNVRDEARLAERPLGKWSVKEHLGHLSDLHPLDMRRVEEFLSGTDILSAADISNQRTADAGHGAIPVARLLETLRDGRDPLTRVLENLTEIDVAATAISPAARRFDATDRLGGVRR